MYKDYLLTDGDTKKLLEEYDSLPLPQQRILQVCSLIVGTENKHDFINYLVKLDLKIENGVSLYGPDFRLIFSQLIKKKLLDNKGNLNPKIIHYIASSTANDDNIYVKNIVARVKRIFISNNKIDFIYGISKNHFQTIHFAIYTNDATPFLNNETVPTQYCSLMIRLILGLSYIDALDAEWLKTRHPIIQIHLGVAHLYDFYGGIVSLASDLNLWITYYRSANFTAIVNEATFIPPYFYSKFLQINVCMGSLESIQKTCESVIKPSFYQQESLGALAFFRGNLNLALHNYSNAIKLFHSLANKQEWPKGNIHVFFYVLALLAQGELDKINRMVTSLKNLVYHDAAAYLLETFFHIKKNDVVAAKQSLDVASTFIEQYDNQAPFLLAMYAWANCLLDPQKIQINHQEYKNKFLQCREIFHYLAAHLYAELVLMAVIDDRECSQFINTGSPFGGFRFLDLMKIKPSWEYAVDQLHNIIIGHANLLNRPKTQEKRLIWLLHPVNLSIDVAEQKMRKDQRWSDGRSISLRRLYKPDSSLDYLSEQDKLALQEGLRQESYGWYGELRFYFDPKHTIINLIGHPLVFHAENRNISLELVKGEIVLQVENTNNGYHLSLSHYHEVPCVILEQETPTRYQVINFSDDFVAIAKIITERGLTVPIDAKDRVIAMISNAKSGIRINSEIDDDNLPVVMGEATCYVHLFPIAGGMKINLWMRPLGDKGHYYRVAQGQNKIITDIITDDGKKLRQKVLRDFAQEKERAKSLLDNCPVLSELDEKNDEWFFESMEDCLELLLELEEYKKNHPLNIEWPKGQNLKLKQVVSFNNLSLSIRGKQDWFEYAGEVKLDNNLVLDMKGLLDLFDNYGNHGRFIKLADGEFIALTEKFKRHLEELKAISEGNKIYRLGTGVLQALVDNTEHTNSDRFWSDHVKRLQSMAKHSPAIPSTLQANLREYQEVGFKYLSRLAHWEIGACLADDMGVGKTVQAITLLLELAPSGPVLVIAPTSVCFIWLEELAKFAPVLNVYILNNYNDRDKLINSLDKMDVLICSYNLLVQTKDIVIEKKWRVVVLDEAQAIKNHDTKRWQCATKLKSNCRIALTGTPIENHLGELWSIFRFLNPGLLGSLQAFQDRYANPIEKYQDPVAKRALKNLVSPYILRRTKTEVLKELPPKTEQSILIEPTAEETAFYEAVRIKALQRLKQLDNSNTPGGTGSKRFSILAEISRLRQACCHSTLVDSDINLASSKIKIFLNITRNLIDNKHKALVFSQYVRYLEKIKEVLNDEKITYQYLDGSTPIKIRQETVQAFQQGEGELFLISLKAGGSGLNLTAADYVIILDPWWNPAVEDQAADRVHRIGQQRPVTIYRLIMKNSIEEKIIKLHKDKKDLADDLLSGSDISGKITEEELMRLIET